MLFICRGGGVALLIGRCWSDSWEFDVNSTGSGIITLIYSLSVENCGMHDTNVGFLFAEINGMAK